MIRKFTGIFILLCFLLIKNGPLFIFDTFSQPAILTALSSLEDLEQKSKDVPEESKSSKYIESADEDFIDHPVLNFTPVLLSASRLNVHFSKQTSAAYLSLPNPPPDGNA